jgi:hypothetical protein
MPYTATQNGTKREDDSPERGKTADSVHGPFRHSAADRQIVDDDGSGVLARSLTANEHPDHDMIATFRRRFRKEIEGLFVWVRELGDAEKLVRQVGGFGDLGEMV